MSGFPSDEAVKMTVIGIALSAEERSGPELIAAGRKAEAVGFAAGLVSDHFHPWNHEQGQSPFVWSVLGALAEATSTISWETGVTCPTLRTHPAIIAQAAATTATLMPGRFRLGVGSGEALNEHILGDAWPRPAVRLEMLEEAIEIIRRLWGGELISHRGTHYTVDRAQLYSIPDAPPPIVVSAFHEKALALAARVGDGFITTIPDAESVEGYRGQGGTGPTQGQLKCCYGPDRAAAIETAHRLWANDSLPGTLAQVLSTPDEFEQASKLVTPAMIAESIPCGPDADEHIAKVQEYVDAGYDEVYIGHIGPNHNAFLEFYAREVLPRFQ
jgi:G6PDH family F420-dependent oxidoreductase